MAHLDPDLEAWLRHALDTDSPFELRPLSGGHSNETALLSTASERWILRRPPATLISSTANNLAREFRVLTVLQGQDVPTPRPIAYAEAGETLARPCLVMECSPGDALTDTWPAQWPRHAGIGDVGRAAIDALAALHRVDVDVAGLADFGRPAHYLQRQVARWRAQAAENAVRDLPHFDEIGHWLDVHRPDEAAPALLHGDFHLDNCLVVAEPAVRVSAIIDWELSTIGDPLVDLGLLLAFWGPQRSAPIAMPAVQAVTRSREAPTRRELADHYTELTGRSTEALTFYMVLALFKLAAIVEGAYARFARGLDDSPWSRSLGEDVPRLLAEAASLLD